MYCCVYSKSFLNLVGLVAPEVVVVVSCVELEGDVPFVDVPLVLV